MNTLRLGPDSSRKVLVAADDRITRFGPGTGEDTSDAGPLVCEDCMIQPGAVNAHTHMYGSLAPLGMPAPKEKPQNFLQILEHIWWRLDRALDERSLRASARYYIAEALLAGTTTLFDHHESPGFIEGSLDVLADACEELGIRAVLCYGATERNHGRKEAEEGLRECRRFILSNRRPLVRGVVGLHASFTVSDDTIREAGELCRELGVVMHVHLSEDVMDVRDARKRGYLGPLERLHDLGALPAGSILAHCVHLDRDQVRRADKLGCWLIQNPRSNMGNEVGYPRTLVETNRVALGTDGYPADMAEEEAALFRAGLAHHETMPNLCRRSAMGAEPASERFGIPLGPLLPGAAADAAAAGKNGPQHVVVGGRVVVQDGRLTTADQEQIRGEAEKEAPRLWKRMKAL